MARQIGKLSAIKVSRVKEKGLYPDGGNLYLQVGNSGAKSWVFRYMRHGKAKTMGLGALHAVPLKDAREKAADCRKLLDLDIDPMQSRKDSVAKAKLAAARSMTFKQCAEAYIEAHQTSWRNAKHKTQWTNTLATYAYPVIDNLPVQDIDVALVMKVLEPIWKEKTETADRLRGRIESILDWAASREYRQGDNPARWRGKLENLLPARTKIQKVKHHPALPYSDIGDFMKDLAEQEGLAAMALELTILAASRTSETLNAHPKEFDLNNKLWIIPAIRIKTGKEHRVPLPDQAVKTIKKLLKFASKDYLFPGKNGKALSNMAMLALLKRMGRNDVTVHGFRSTFRDWAAEQTNYAREVAEAALSHAVGDKVEAAYRRGDMFEKRRQLMNEWARYCYQQSSKGKVLKINR